MIRSGRLEKVIQIFGEKVADKHQPAQKLHDATVNAARYVHFLRNLTLIWIARADMFWDLAGVLVQSLLPKSYWQPIFVVRSRQH